MRHIAPKFHIMVNDIFGFCFVFQVITFAAHGENIQKRVRRTMEMEVNPSGAVSKRKAEKHVIRGASFQHDAKLPLNVHLQPDEHNVRATPNHFGHDLPQKKTVNRSNIAQKNVPEDCEWSKHGLAAARSAYAAWYSTPANFLANLGYLVQSNSADLNSMWFPASAPPSSLLDDAALPPNTGPVKTASMSMLKMWTCMVPQNNNLWFHAQRIGPFFSMGGGSRYVMSMEDVANFSVALEQFNGNALFGNVQIHLVDAQGNDIPHPPLYHHHTHLQAGRSFYYRDHFRCIVLHQEEHCRTVVPYYVAGTQSSVNLDVVSPVLKESFSYLQTSFGMWMDVFDVREQDSEVLEWYWFVKFYSKPYTNSTRPISSTLFYPMSASSLFLMNVAYKTESFVWFCHTFGTEGELIPKLTFFHEHGLNFAGFKAFHASPTDLGLSAQKFRDAPASEALLPQNVGMRSNAQVEEYILYHLNISRQQSYMQGKALPSLKCEKSLQCDPWKFKKDDNLVVVVFFDDRVFDDQVETLQHTGFYLYYYTPDKLSLSQTQLRVGTHEPSFSRDIETPDGRSLLMFEYITGYHISSKHQLTKIDIFLYRFVFPLALTSYCIVRWYSSLVLGTCSLILIFCIRGMSGAKKD
eukprot:gnl/MRDRNA2_/MRDRNA2_73333_c0_seq1.p1 gnl/MRDRNA2_/MRDRNA2_73333_c0~~gnl/MRDRNA2_/MRDRNA2_73333_c0_seq1.p1  ORF type:complete len:635 (+),score=53.73 gnl/MRDRNA2_/MRDRNA2_73333_c0_seq1:67-1971(+)